MESKNNHTDHFISITKNRMVAIVHVEFGSPMKNCLHYGICRVTVPSATMEKPCACQSKALIKNLGNGLLQFIFSKKEMPLHVFEKYFSSAFFHVDDKYEVPVDVLGKINMQKTIIKKGSYPILMDGDSLKIVF